MKETCSDCAYGIEGTLMTKAYLDCHRYPQTVKVIKDRCCGEFKAKPKAKKEKKA